MKCNFLFIFWNSCWLDKECGLNPPVLRHNKMNFYSKTFQIEILRKNKLAPEKYFIWVKCRFIYTFIPSLKLKTSRGMYVCRSLLIVVNIMLHYISKNEPFKVDSSQELLSNQYLPTTIRKQNWNFLSLLTSPYLRIQWLAHNTCT